MRSDVVALGLGLTLAAAAAAAEPVTPADLVITGRVWTGDRAHPWAESVAIRGERIVRVGEARGARRLKGVNTRTLSFPGGLIVPGFNDAHIHLMEGALSLERVDLIEEGSVEKVQARVRAFAA